MNVGDLEKPGPDLRGGLVLTFYSSQQSNKIFLYSPFTHRLKTHSLLLLLLAFVLFLLFVCF